EVELLMHLVPVRANRLFREAELCEPLLDGGHRLGVRALRLARTLRSRLDAHGHERAIGCATDDRVADRHDDRTLRLRRLLCCDRRGERRQEKNHGPHAILNPMLCAYVSGGTLCRYAHRSIDASSFTHEPPRR